MKQYKTEAIILDTTDVFDADRSFLLFSEQLGKIRARAKGVRKPTSKLTGHLLVFIPTNLELIETGDFFLIIQAHVTNQNHNYPRDSLLFMSQVAIIAEAISKLFTEREPHPEVYDGLSYTLHRLRVLCENDSRRVAKLVTTEFLLKALASLGYRPELYNCVATTQPISKDFIGWDSQLGGVISREGATTSHGSIQIIKDAKSLLVLRQLLQPEFTAERLRTDEDIEAEASIISYDYIQTQIGQPLMSLHAGF